MLNVFVAAGVGAAAAAAILGAGTAAATPSAADVVGMKYADALQAIQQLGSTPKIASRTGSKVSEGECLVTNAWMGYFVRDGRRSPGEIMVALNCNGALASAGSPGNSAASPEGRQAIASQEQGG